MAFEHVFALGSVSQVSVCPTLLAETVVHCAAHNSVIFHFLNDLICALVYFCIFIPRTMTLESIRDKAVTQKALCGADAKHRCEYQARSQRALHYNTNAYTAFL